MKIKLILIIIFLQIGLLFTSCENPSIEKPDNDVMETKGVIMQIDDNYIIIQNDAGEEYGFIINNTPVYPQKKELMKGDTINLYYYGKLDYEKEWQEVNLKKIEIIKSDPIEEMIKMLIESMSLEEKCGQLFFIRCPGNEAVNIAKTYQPGGYILFAVDFDNKSQDDIINEINSYQEVLNIPLFIGTDEEGGIVNRVSKFKEFRAEPFKSPQELYKTGGFNLIESDTMEKCQLLKRLGINVNFAPVCDVSINNKDFIYSRSFGQNAEMTSQYTKIVVNIMNEQNMGSVLKHFPGYGNNKDTHSGSAYDERNYETFLNSDFLPFAAGIEAGAGCVLVSHNIIKSMDQSTPASLSIAVHRILRDDLSFDGVIITDDLSMEAIVNFTDSETAASISNKGRK